MVPKFIPYCFHEKCVYRRQLLYKPTYSMSQFSGFIHGQAVILPHHDASFGLGFLPTGVLLYCQILLNFRRKFNEAGLCTINNIIILLLKFSRYPQEPLSYLVSLCKKYNPTAGRVSFSRVPCIFVSKRLYYLVSFKQLNRF